jgi:predicted alpha/beta-hydrolase family hydrolase
MLAWKARLETFATVAMLDYPYMLAKKRMPDPLSRLIAAHREALAQATAGHEGPVFLAGKSMGSRVGCHLSLEEGVRDVAGLICFGYPLKGMGPKGAIRDEVLRALTKRILFVQGTRDSLCPLELLAQVRGQMASPNELFVVEGGDHSLAVAKGELARRGLTQETVDGEILRTVRAFVER